MATSQIICDMPVLAHKIPDHTDNPRQCSNDHCATTGKYANGQKSQTWLERMPPIFLTEWT